MKRIKHKFIAERCTCCGMKLEYKSDINKGLVKLLAGFAKTVKEKGINCIHPEKEAVTKGYLTHKQANNLTHLKIHGLIAKVKNEPANWCLTTKGISFLKGAEIARCQIRNKAEKRTTGAWHGDEYRCTIRDFDKEKKYWDFEDFEVKEGRVITDPSQIGNQDHLI